MPAQCLCSDRNFSFDDVHVKAARSIARLARECGVQRLIHFSALNASPTPPAIIWRKPSRFLQSKVSLAFSSHDARRVNFQYAGELAVREEFPGATIFRPSAIYGNQFTDGFIAYHFSRCKFWSIICLQRDHRRFPFVVGVRPISFYRVPLYASGERTVKAPIFVSEILIEQSITFTEHFLVVFAVE